MLDDNGIYDILYVFQINKIVGWVYLPKKKGVPYFKAL